MMRHTMLAVVLVVIIGPVMYVETAPLPHILTHKNIVMTLHGLLDHVDVGRLEIDNGQSAKEAYQDFANNIHRGILPKHCDTEQKLVIADEISTIYDAMDLDDDNRLMLDEACAFLIAAVASQSETTLTKAEWAFKKLQAKNKVSLLTFDAIAAWSHPARLSMTGMESLFVSSDVDNNQHLDQTEFVHYYAPEFGFPVLKEFAARYLETHDADNDGHLDIAEFLNATLLLPEEGDNQYSAQAFDYRSENKERQREFEQDLDINKNGVLEQAELVALADPRHFLHAVNQAYVLFIRCDANGDHELEPEELGNCCATLARVSSLNLEQELHANLDNIYVKLGHRLKRLVNNHLHDEL
eukprot:m.24599 g.24599  ORF g.24599 m.24599 type:complete len:355 (+) comp11534_c0_seq2:363-1427(+)